MFDQLHVAVGISSLASVFTEVHHAAGGQLFCDEICFNIQRRIARQLYVAADFHQIRIGIENGIIECQADIAVGRGEIECSVFKRNILNHGFTDLFSNQPYVCIGDIRCNSRVLNNLNFVIVKE